ncbi:MAG: tRNA lysidine(34) synthetase TilS [Phycisphaera sp.]|nr:tRNA lysidine(34) synthetase TilS [Phycisphaera sp.]
MSDGAAPIHSALARDEVLLQGSRHPLAARLSEGLAAAEVAVDERVVLLVSGGGDSMALLVLMAALRGRTDPTLDSLAVLSVDHGLREESAAECAHAVSVARTLGIRRAETARVEVARTGNLLDAARSARLAAVERFAAREAIGTAILAHHADDLAESILIGLARGAGLASLAALLPRREFGPTLRLVRPLLGARRAELRALLEEAGIGWCEDPSNAMHARGGLRSDPALAALVDSIALGAGRLAEEARGLLEWRDAEVARILSGVAPGTAVARELLAGAHYSLAKPLLKAFARREGIELPASVASAIVGALESGDRAPKRYSCADGAVVEIDARKLSFTRATGRRG